MNTLTVKIPQTLELDMAQAIAREHVSKSEWVRRALVAYVQRSPTQAAQSSALDLAGDLVGCFAGGPVDLASNPTHLVDFGKV